MGAAMKRMSLILTFMLLGCAPAAAQYGKPLLLESTPDVSNRQGAERYQQYQQNNSQPPLGGYPERLGDPAPRGTPNPGFVTPGDGGSNDSGRGSNNGSPWR